MGRRTGEAGRVGQERGLGVAVTRSQCQEQVGDTQATGTGTGGQRQPARPRETEGNAAPGSAVTRGHFSPAAVLRR